MKKPINQGQQFITEVEAALEINGNRPIGMPSLEDISTELKRLGFGKVDAEDVFDFWLSNGFRTGVNKIKDWRAAIRIMIRHKRLPSQRADAPGLVQHKLEKPAQLKEAERDRKQHLGREATDQERRDMGYALRQWRKQQ